MEMDELEQLLIEQRRIERELTKKEMIADRQRADEQMRIRYKNRIFGSPPEIIKTKAKQTKSN